MILGILRVFYFFGPVLCLSTIVLNKRSTLGWYLWGFACLITAIYWIAFFTAKEDGAVETSVIPLAIWTPMLVSTFIAGITRPKWLAWGSSPALMQFVMIGVCIIPSIIFYFLFR